MSCEYLVPAPTHVCPKCGNWWDVRRSDDGSWQMWEHGHAGTAFRQNQMAPTCPRDGEGLEPWLVIEMETA